MRLRGIVRMGVCTAAVLVLLAVAVASYTAYLLNGENVRLRIQTALTHALGRPVTMAHLHLSPWTGTAIADDFRIADDPAFSPEPFVQAGSIRIGLDNPMLLLHRQIRIRSLELQRPGVHLLRDARNKWNFQNLGPAHSTRREPQDRGPGNRGETNVDISSIVVEQGSVLVRTLAADGSEVDRTFGISTLQVRYLGVGRSSPFQFAVQLPGGGSVVASGVAGPWNEGDASKTSVQAHLDAHLEAHHLQLSAAGLVSADQPLSGDVERAAVDLHLDGSVFSVSQLSMDSSRLVVRPSRPAAAQTGAGHATTTTWNRLLERLVVRQAQVHAGALEIERADGQPIRLQAVQATLRDWSPGGRAAFTMSALAGSGTLRATGSFRVPTPGDAQSMTVDAQVSTSHLHLAGSGLLPTGAPVDAVADSSVRVQVAQHALEASGSFRLTSLRLVRNGQPSAVPVAGSFRLHQAMEEGRSEGTLEQATVQLGRATLQTQGSYAWAGTGPALRLTLSGDRMPVDALESFLPSAGVVLPEGSRLEGGTLSVSLKLEGSPARPEVSGPVLLKDARLTGFDLGSKLRSLASFTGGRLGSATASGTEIRSLSFTLHAGSGTVVTDRLSADIAGIGTATGSGTIGPGGALDYHLALKLTELVPGNDGPTGLANKLAGSLPPAWARRAQGAINYLSRGPMKNGVPLLIRGTARKPSITPDLGALLPTK